MFRTSYSIVAVARQVPNQFALLWLCQYAPSSSSYAPFYVASAAVPLPYSRYIILFRNSFILFTDLEGSNYALNICLLFFAY
jgi:hypothetical protein